MHILWTLLNLTLGNNTTTERRSSRFGKKLGWNECWKCVARKDALLSKLPLQMIIFLLSRIFPLDSQFPLIILNSIFGARNKTAFKALLLYFDFMLRGSFEVMVEDINFGDKLSTGILSTKYFLFWKFRFKYKLFIRLNIISSNFTI